MEAEDDQTPPRDLLTGELALELSEEKTLITHAREEKAHFLGYEVHTLHADDKHDQRGQRCINGAIGLAGTRAVITTHCAKYMQAGQTHATLLQRVHDSAYSIVAQYQTEYRGVVQYYRMAYNLHQLQKLKRVMETSLTGTLAMKFKTSRTKSIGASRPCTTRSTGPTRCWKSAWSGDQRKRRSSRALVAIPLRWNRWVKINDAPTKPIWSGRSEVVERLLADTCELCGATDNIEVHHIRKLKDLDRARPAVHDHDGRR